MAGQLEAVECLLDHAANVPRWLLTTSGLTQPVSDLLEKHLIK